MENFSVDLYKDYSSQNLKKLLAHENLKQNEFAALMEVTPATVSNYLKNQIPNTEFLLRLKELYPYINIDDFLCKRISFDNLSRKEETPDAPKVMTDIYKYYGLYNLYYLDTATTGIAKSNHVYLNSSPVLKMGLLYIYQDTELGNDRAGCVALFNVSDKEFLTKLRQHVEDLAARRLYNALKARDASTGSDTGSELDLAYFMQDAQTARIFQNELLENKLSKTMETTYSTYSGDLQMTHNHMNFRFHQSIDYEEPISIILHRKYFRKEQYIGGLGCMTKASSGHPSDPCLQLIGISHPDMNVFDDEIKQRLRFGSPLEISSSSPSLSEEKQLLQLASMLFKPPVGMRASNAMYELSPEDKAVLFRSKLHYLLRSNVEKNLLYFTRISLENDHEWYRLITGKITGKHKAGEES